MLSAINSVDQEATDSPPSTKTEYCLEPSPKQATCKACKSTIEKGSPRLVSIYIAASNPGFLCYFSNCLECVTQSQILAILYLHNDLAQTPGLGTFPIRQQALVLSKLFQKMRTSPLPSTASSVSLSLSPVGGKVKNQETRVQDNEGLLELGFTFSKKKRRRESEAGGDGDGEPVVAQQCGGQKLRKAMHLVRETIVQSTSSSVAMKEWSVDEKEEAGVAVDQIQEDADGDSMFSRSVLGYSITERVMSQRLDESGGRNDGAGVTGGGASVAAEKELDTVEQEESANIMVEAGKEITEREKRIHADGDGIKKVDILFPKGDEDKGGRRGGDGNGDAEGVKDKVKTKKRKNRKG
ncbi:UNVERIFIED_CONTAM: hypothetical protein HDU68_007274 [Siphonaria sp. JEL0065]|nr:hypothetical protein HDU68_007274 [Siphonaria sp. JEL0065]